MKNKLLFGYVFLVIQIILVIYAQFVPERFFCWAPYDEQTSYEINVEINGVALKDEEVGKRYRYGQKRTESRTIHNIISIINQYETSYGKNDNAKVTLTYSTNGHPQQKWTYPN